MKELKKNLRQALDFLTYFDNCHVKIESFNNDIEVVLSSANYCVIIFDGRDIHFEINDIHGTIDGFNMEDRIGLVAQIKEYLK